MIPSPAMAPPNPEKTMVLQGSPALGSGYRPRIRDACSWEMTPLSTHFLDSAQSHRISFPIVLPMGCMLHRTAESPALKKMSEYRLEKVRLQVFQVPGK